MSTGYQPWAQWIGVETIAMLYVRVMDTWGGARSDPKPGCIDAAMGAAYNAELYSPENDQEGFVSGLIFACYLLFYLTSKHCYIDGNKRIAWACMTFVLLNFGLTIKASEDEVVEFCLAISKGEIENGASVVSWVSEKLVSVA